MSTSEFVPAVMARELYDDLVKTGLRCKQLITQTTSEILRLQQDRVVLVRQRDDALAPGEALEADINDKASVVEALAKKPPSREVDAGLEARNIGVGIDNAAAERIHVLDTLSNEEARYLFANNPVVRELMRQALTAQQLRDNVRTLPECIDAFETYNSLHWNSGDDILDISQLPPLSPTIPQSSVATAAMARADTRIKSDSAVELCSEGADTGGGTGAMLSKGSSWSQASKMGGVEAHSFQKQLDSLRNQAASIPWRPIAESWHLMESYTTTPTAPTPESDLPTSGHPAATAQCAKPRMQLV